MGYFQVRYNSRVVNYDHRGFIILATNLTHIEKELLGLPNRQLEFKIDISPTEITCFLDW